MVHLQLRHGAVAVEAELAAAAGRRAFLEAFRSPAQRPILARVIGGDTAGLGHVLDERYPHLGRYAVEGDVVRVELAEDPMAAEAALRVGVAVAAARSGGLLLHGAAVYVAGHALLALGPSGAGKTTLAFLARAAGATVLSDENVLWYPDGMVQGTPFRSDPGVEPSAEILPLALAVTLKKADDERLAPVDPHRMAAAVLEQAYRVPPEVLSPRDYLRRSARFVELHALRELSFRKDPAAGKFLVDLLRAPSERGTGV